MAIKLPHSIPNKMRLGAPNTPARTTRKPARSRAFPAPPLGQCWPGHWPGQPGPNFGQGGPFPGPPGAGQLPVKLGPPLDVRGVAALIGCSPWTVRQTLIPRGLPHFRFKASGRLVFYRDQVIRWIENQQQGGKTTK